MVVFPIGFETTELLPSEQEMVPLGGIIQWSGAIVDIPVGWQLCDGTNGTPDLRNKFVPGAGDAYAVDEAGGFVDHTHLYTGDGHVHTMPLAGQTVVAVGTDFAEGAFDTESTQEQGTTDAAENLPPFLALAYIQRMV